MTMQIWFTQLLWTLIWLAGIALAVGCVFGLGTARLARTRGRRWYGALLCVAVAGWAAWRLKAS